MTRPGRKRVVVFSPGYAEYAYRFAAGLAENADVLLVVDRGNLARELEGLQIPAPASMQVVSIDFRPIWKMYLQFPALLRRMWAFKPDVVHLQEVTHTVCALVERLWRGRAALVLTVHDPEPHSGSDSLLKPSVRKAMADARRLADGVVLHGPACLSRYRELYGDAKPLLSIPHGAILVPRDHQRRASIPGRVLFFGRVERYKGLPVLLEAAGLLRARRPDIQIHVAGRGEDLNAHRQLAESLPNVSLDERFLPAEDVIAAFQEAEVVVAPYIDATQSGVVAAAFGNDRPVVASRVGGLADAVEDGVDGLLVEPRNGAALADALESLCGSPRLRAMADAAGVKARTTLAWSHIATDALAFYDTLTA